MFKFNRQKLRSILTISLISVIALAFALFGLGDFFRSGNNSTAAIVNGKKISWQTIDSLYTRMQSHFGDRQDEKTIKDQIRIALVQRYALLGSMKSLGFRVGEEQLAQTLVQMAPFQIDGKFSKERYLETIKKATYTDAEFRQELTQDLLLGQLEQGLQNSNFSLESELNQVVGLFEQTRDFGYFVLPIKKYREGIKVKPEEIQAYYDSHKASFVVPEQVSLDYVELNLEKLAKTIDVNDETLQSYYKEHIVQYTAPEAVSVRHILIAAPDLPSAAAQDAAAKQKASDFLTQLKNGADFEKLAKENSADEGSASKGGDLGWFLRGQMVPEFEKAAFGIKNKKEYAGPVRTQFGYHILQLQDKKAADVRAFKEVRNLVKEQYQREKAFVLFDDKVEQMSKLSFDHPNSLAQLAEKLDLKVLTTDSFPRQGSSSPVTSHKEVLNVAFSPELLEKKLNSKPIKLNEENTIVFRVKQHKPTEQQALVDVNKQIDSTLITEKAQEMVKEQGEKLAKALNAKESPEKLAKAYGLNWVTKKKVYRADKEIDQSLLMKAFQAAHPTEDSPSVQMTNLSSGDYAVLNITKIHPGELQALEKEKQAAFRTGFKDFLSQLEFSFYTMDVFNNQTKAEFPDPPKR